MQKIISLPEGTSPGAAAVPILEGMLSLLQNEKQVITVCTHYVTS